MVNVRRDAMGAPPDLEELGMPMGGRSTHPGKMAMPLALTAFPEI